MNTEINKWIFGIGNRESVEIEIQQRVGLNPFCICHSIISFYNREKLIFMQTQSRLWVTCVTERYKGWDEIWITKDRIVVHNQQRRIDSLFYS